MEEMVSFTLSGLHESILSHGVRTVMLHHSEQIKTNIQASVWLIGSLYMKIQKNVGKYMEQKL